MAQRPAAPLAPLVAAALPADDTALAVACSGGGDSMALLDLARAACTGRALHAVTVDHGLRAEAADEAALVARYCVAHGIAHEVLHWQGSAATGNTMAAAREARYALIARWAAGQGVGAVLLAHTQDDQAETLLMALGRKAGMDGLAGMAPHFTRDGIAFHRPLLTASRAALRDHLRAAGIDWAEDPTNDDHARERTRARAALTALGPLGITAESLAAVARNAAMAREVVEQAAEAAARGAVRFLAGEVTLATRQAHPMPAELHRRLLRAAIAFVGHDLPRQSALDELEGALARGAASHTIGGCLIRPAEGAWHIGREPAAVAHLTCPPGAPWDGRWRLDGPAPQGAETRALTATGLSACPRWRETGLPRETLAASPALWQGDTLIAAPLAGLARGFTATPLRDAAHFRSLLVSH